MVSGSAITIPHIPYNTPPANTENTVRSAGTLFDLPYTLGDIKYPSIFGHINATISVNINNLLDTKNAVIAAIIFEKIPPKYGIIVDTEHKTPSNK